MTSLEQLEQAYRIAANGDEEAFRFLVRWHEWCHRIDDFIDDEGPREAVVPIAAGGIVVFGSRFFQDHFESLSVVAAVVAEKYFGSLAERHPVMRDVLRLAGNDMVLAVASITGGFEALRTTREALVPIIVNTQLEEA